VLLERVDEAEHLACVAFGLERHHVGRDHRDVGGVVREPGVVERLPEPGELQVVDNMLFSAGGCAANAAMDLARLGVRVYLMEEVRQRGLRRALDDALRIASQDTAGFGISIDLDVVTPEDAPGVAVPAEGGLGGAELAQALEGIGGRPGLTAVELVEYCPRLDKGGRSAQVAVDLLAAALCGSRDEAKVVAEALDR